jgi:hypothetical protein
MGGGRWSVVVAMASMQGMLVVMMVVMMVALVTMMTMAIVMVVASQWQLQLQKSCCGFRGVMHQPHSCHSRLGTEQARAFVANNKSTEPCWEAKHLVERQRDKISRNLREVERRR